MDHECIIFFFDLLELKKRNIKEINAQWSDAYDLLLRDDISVIEGMCSKWLEQLPSVYYEFYEKVFSKNYTYLYGINAEYCIKQKKTLNLHGNRYYMYINNKFQFVVFL